MNVTQRPVLRPIRGRDFDFDTQQTELAANTSLTVAGVTLLTLSELNVLADTLYFVQADCHYVDGGVLGDKDAMFRITHTDLTAVSQFVNNDADGVFSRKVVDSGENWRVVMTTYLRVTTGGNLDINLIGHSSPANGKAVAGTTRLSFWQL